MDDQVKAIAAKLASAYKEEAVVSTFKREQGEAGGQEGAEAATPMQVETGAAAAEAAASRRPAIVAFVGVVAGGVRGADGGASGGAASLFEAAPAPAPARAAREQ